MFSIMNQLFFKNFYLGCFPPFWRVGILLIIFFTAYASQGLYIELSQAKE